MNVDRINVQGATVLHQQGYDVSVLLNGDDVTRDVRLANRRRGYVVLLCRDEHGRAYIGPMGRVATELRRGNVEIRVGRSLVDET